MENASVHRIDDSQIKRLKATQIAFFPANTTSQLQPMDAGIIQAFKLYYRQSLHSHIMHKVKADITCNPLKDVTIALAIVWVFRAWCKVNPRTISKCFAKCGFKGTDDTETAAVTADLPLPEVAAGDTEELALSAAEMEEDNIFPPIAKAGTCLSKLLLPSMLRRSGSQGRGSWSWLVWIRRSTNRMMRLRTRSPLPRPSWRLWTPSNCTPWPAGMSRSGRPRST